jgi:hypothetical protein
MLGVLLCLVLFAVGAYLTLPAFQKLQIIKDESPYAKMLDQEPTAGSYAPVGCTFDVAVQWQLKEFPPGVLEQVDPWFYAKFEVYDTSTNQKILTTTSEPQYFTVAKVGDRFWTWGRDQYVQPEADVLVRCELYVGVSNFQFAVFEWIGHYYVVPKPENAVVFFNIGYYYIYANKTISRPIKGAYCRVYNSQYNFEAYTDENGLAKIVNIPPGDYTVTVNAEGFEPLQQSITLTYYEWKNIYARLKSLNSTVQQPPPGTTSQNENYHSNPSDNPKQGQVTTHSTTATYEITKDTVLNYIVGPALIIFSVVILAVSVKARSK